MLSILRVRNTYYFAGSAGGYGMVRYEMAGFRPNPDHAVQDATHLR